MQVYQRPPHLFDCRMLDLTCSDPQKVLAFAKQDLIFSDAMEVKNE